MHVIRKILSVTSAVILLLSTSAGAFAEEYYLDNGDITIEGRDDGTYVTQGQTQERQTYETTIMADCTDNTVDIIATSSDVAVTFNCINIYDVNNENFIDVSGDKSIDITFKGDNTINVANGSAIAGNASNVSITGQDTYSGKAQLHIETENNNSDNCASIDLVRGRFLDVEEPSEVPDMTLEINNISIEIEASGCTAGIHVDNSMEKYPSKSSPNVFDADAELTIKNSDVATSYSGDGIFVSAYHKASINVEDSNLSISPNSGGASCTDYLPLDYEYKYLTVGACGGSDSELKLTSCEVIEPENSKVETFELQKSSTDATPYNISTVGCNTTSGELPLQEFLLVSNGESNAFDSACALNDYYFDDDEVTEESEDDSGVAEAHSFTFCKEEEAFGGITCNGIKLIEGEDYIFVV